MKKKGFVREGRKRRGRRKETDNVKIREGGIMSACLLCVCLSREG
jgi:hypothetical protein